MGLVESVQHQDAGSIPGLAPVDERIQHCHSAAEVTAVAQI